MIRLSRLKTATGAVHQRLHQIVRLPRLTASHQEYRRALLGYLFAIAPLEALARQVIASGQAPSIPSLPDYDPAARMHKTDWLFRDLQYCGIDSGQVIQLFPDGFVTRYLDAVRQCSELPEDQKNRGQEVTKWRSAPAMLTAPGFPSGVSLLQGFPFPASLPLNQQRDFLAAFQYVTEGMTMGSQLVYQALHRDLGMTSETGARFFYAYGDQDTSRQNWDRCRQWLESQPLNELAVIQIAIQIFVWFETALSLWLMPDTSPCHA